MKHIVLITLLFQIALVTTAQDPFGLEELKMTSNNFTEYVMNAGQSLHDKISPDLVPIQVADFNLEGQDSISILKIEEKFVEYYDYLLRYQKQTGITTNHLASIFVESANDSSNSLKCFNSWYATEAHTIAITLSCYQSDIESVKESCIARSILSTIINDANVADCMQSYKRK